MNEQLVDQIKKLKETVFRQKESAADINSLLGEDIDRDFHLDLWELSEKELDHIMGDRLTFLNQDLDPRDSEDSISSHRKGLGKLIVWLKKRYLRVMDFYTEFLLTRQARFNPQLVAFHLASFIRFRHNEQKINTMTEKIKNLEEEQELLHEEVRQLKNLISNLPTQGAPNQGEKPPTPPAEKRREK